MNSAIERLELKIAYLERANNELSDVVYGQRRELDELRARMTALLEQIASLKPESQPYSSDDERPPHY